MRVHINRIIGLLHVAAILKCPDLTRFKCPFGVSACWRVQVIRSPTMDTMRMITMTRRQISRLKTIQAVTEGNLKAVTAAAQLGLCRLQIDRMADRYRDDGPSGLVPMQRGLRHHQLPASAVDVALSIIRDRYPDSGPTLACENLRERHSISLASGASGSNCSPRRV